MRNNNGLGETISFGYDHLDRLLSASSGLFSENNTYTNTGNFLTKGGVAYTYPSAGNSRPHAPTQVGANTYTYDDNGNLTNAESRVYTYDVENRLSQVSGASLPTRGFTFDGDGVLRTMSSDGTPTKRYISRDYQVNPTTGEVLVYYRFGDRAVAWKGNGALRYLLADHLSSSHAEVGTDQSELGQRRYYPFGGDRPATITGMADLTQDERCTGQWRIEGAGGSNDKKELYYYGARWYLPGVGIFTQPDTIVPDYKNPQALNRFSYVLNNPLRYMDNSGHFALIPVIAAIGAGYLVGRISYEAMMSKIPGGDRARRDQIGGAFVTQMSEAISRQSANRGVDSTVVGAILRHESAAIERRTLTPLSNMTPGPISDAAETMQAYVQGDLASVGPGQMQIRRAQELEQKGYVDSRGSREERIAALLGNESSVGYVSGMVQYLSDQPQGMAGFTDLSMTDQQRLALIGYNIGWEALEASIESRDLLGTVAYYGYDDQTLDEYLRWQGEQ